MAIKFYSTKPKWGCFSNFSKHALFVNGKSYPTAEHYYQSQKFVTVDPEYAEKIRTAASPKEAAILGRAKREPSIRADWDLVKDEVMRAAIRHKFITHDVCRAILFETGNEEIIEDSPRDYYWGCGADNSGKNMLGKILMEVRDALKSRYLDLC